MVIYSPRGVHDVALRISEAAADGFIPDIEVSGWHSVPFSEAPMLDLTVDGVDCSLGENPRSPTGIALFDDHGEPITASALISMASRRTRVGADAEALRQSLRRLYEAFLTTFKDEAAVACDRSVETLREEIHSVRP